MNHAYFTRGQALRSVLHVGSILLQDTTRFVVFLEIETEQSNSFAYEITPEQAESLGNALIANAHMARDSNEIERKRK